MRISTKGRYALRMMADLAEHRDEGFIALKDIANRQDISKKYLEQIVTLFNRSDLIHANRGSQGGYKLAVAPSECRVSDILRLTEGSLAPVSCADDQPTECDRMIDCPVYPVWKGLAKVINDYLDGITLQDIIDQKHERDPFSYII